MSTSDAIGLIAGNGRLPLLFACAARERGLKVIAAAHVGEATDALAGAVDEIHWVRIGQIGRILRAFRRAGVRQAVMAGGIGKMRGIANARPDLTALRIAARLRSLRDDALLRGVARYFEEQGVEIVAPHRFVPQLLAPEGHLEGPPLTEAQRQDVELGFEVARALGEVDVGQTVVLRGRNVLALEAVEGTDEAIRRGAKLGGPGVVVVKRKKPPQDDRFDLPAVGPETVRTMAEVQAAVLAVEAGQTLLIDAPELLEAARRSKITVVGVPPGEGLRAVRKP